MSEDSNTRIPWFEPLIDESDAEAVKRQTLTGFVNEGPANRVFEQMLRDYFKMPYAVTTPSCTVALALTLMALGIRRGDTVLVPDVTFIGTAGAVRLAGGEPILVDIDPVNFTMDPEDARRCLQPSTKVILYVYLNGRAGNIEALRSLAREKGLLLMEDAAEALGSRNAKGFLGTLSEAGCFSLAPTKIITSGQGGFVLTRRQDIRDQLVRLKDHGRLSRESDVHAVTGFNFKVTDLQIALAISQWRKLDQRIARSRQLDESYCQGLSGLPEIEFTARDLHGGYLMWPDFKCKRRDALVAHMQANGITLRPFWPAIHTQPAYACKGAFPGANEVSQTACWLPCSPDITDIQVNRVVLTIRDFFKAGKGAT
ncbi:MAG: DegT/DnrJ/EryC1/StrS family aminotransferase [Kiritimatiellia bacterium]|nr:DegT/DnrJ/EryC1/StrS family aminotransferase [Kiritimatiellia bacterium]